MTKRMTHIVYRLLQNLLKVTKTIVKYIIEILRNALVIKIQTWTRNTLVETVRTMHSVECSNTSKCIPNKSKEKKITTLKTNKERIRNLKEPVASMMQIWQVISQDSSSAIR